MSLKSEGKGSSDQACQTTLRSCSIMVFQGFGIGLFGLYIACQFVARWSLWAAAGLWSSGWSTRSVFHGLSIDEHACVLRWESAQPTVHKSTVTGHESRSETSIPAASRVRFNSFQATRLPVPKMALKSWVLAAFICLAASLSLRVSAIVSSAAKVTPGCR